MNSASRTIFYDHAQVVRWLDASTVKKGEPDAEHVIDLEHDDEYLTGLVPGAAKRLYEVEVYFEQINKKNFDIDGYCTCPVGYNCKHVAAVLLAAMNENTPNAKNVANSAVRGELTYWLSMLRQQVNVVAKPPKSLKAPTKCAQGLAYALVWSSFDDRFEVKLFKASLDREGNIRSIGDAWSGIDKALLKPPQFIREEDLVIFRMLWADRAQRGHTGFSLSGANGALAMEKMLATKRLFVSDKEGKTEQPALRVGNSRQGKIQWEVGPQNRLHPVLQTEPPSSFVFLTEPAWYVDQTNGEGGTVETLWNPHQLKSYLSMPPVSLQEAPLVGAALKEISQDFPAPPTREAGQVLSLKIAPTPVLRLSTVPVYSVRFGKYQQTNVKTLDIANVNFDYDGFRFTTDNTDTLVNTVDGQIAEIQRQIHTETKWMESIHTTGLQSIKINTVYGLQTFTPGTLILDDPEKWPDFMLAILPDLRNNGWRVEMSDSFRFNIIDIDAIEGNIQEAADGWFDVEMGISVSGRTVRLEPLLAELFGRDPRWLNGSIESIDDDERIELKTDRGERLRLRAERLKPVVRVLIDLFDGMKGGSVRISRFDAGRVEALSDTGRWQFHGDDSCRKLAQRLKNSSGVGDIPAPKSLTAELRGYQQHGLSWMQFLREHDLSGVLADDMGLGKTIQTLAHILVEKEAGRLDKPALIVLPTSLVHNWCDEAQRFAPSLRVLNLHGTERKAKFEQIAEHDLIITTYGLLWRDEKILASHSYHLLILDEAQVVKNATTKASATIRDLKARHRLCLTGTPMENHLGELWSLFDFLLPGFLGTQKDFGKHWRTPIEKNGDTVRRDLLARRIRPFMLRRLKDEVATELPPKTIILRTVDLEDAQRDLYEAVRSAMHEKVREIVKAQGLNRSHIVVLDALLKLRQVCCDPRLVKLTKAANVKESAKLEMLMEMLPEMIEEGRRVLLFSQFTGMLELIAAAVEKAGIPYVLLTGQTNDRATPIKKFQNGEVPLFLISLKAGGTGLNLTAADTVIHYDPWWNPAAENQATDRAHRLGQDKPVFVYKLIVSGSIEEKIVALQEKKAALAEGILSEDGAAAVKFSADDLEALFAPMPLMK